MNKTAINTILIFALTVLSACGGAGTNGTGNTGGISTPQPTKAVVKLSTSGTTTQIAGVDVTIALPSGVTVKSTVSPPETDAGVVIASGQAAANSLVTGVSTAVSGASPATVHLVLANSNANGFGAGEFATITCDLASGATPTASGFTVQSSKVDNTSASEILGATVSAAVVLE